MENYHIKMALNLIEKHNLFGSLSVVQAARAKKAIVEIIIPTDISKHFALQAQFESKQGRFDVKSEEDKNLLMAAYLHTCDLSPIPFCLSLTSDAGECEWCRRCKISTTRSKLYPTLLISLHFPSSNTKTRRASALAKLNLQKTLSFLCCRLSARNGRALRHFKTQLLRTAQSMRE